MDTGPRSFTASYGGRGKDLMALSWVFFVVGISVVSLRTYTTLFITKRPRWDLWFTLIATALSITAQAFLVLAVLKGIGNQVQKVAPPDLADALFWQWCFYCPTVLSTVFSKFGTAVLILQIQDRTFARLKWTLWAVLAVNTALGVLMPTLFFLQCNPTSDLWMTNPNVNPTCKLAYTVLVAGTVQGSWSAFTDFFLAVYPAFIFWHLNMSLKRRIGICVLFAGGFVAGAGAIVKTVRIFGLKTTTNPTGVSAELMTWAFLEQWLIIIMITMPPLRPLFVKFYNTVSTRGSSKGKSDDSGSGGFYELNKGGKAGAAPHPRPVHDDIEAAYFGNAQNGPRGYSVSTSKSDGTFAGKKSTGNREAWIEGGSSEEDILASHRRVDVGPPFNVDVGFISGEHGYGNRGAHVQRDYTAPSNVARAI